eukprot:g2914.t1
MPNQGQYLNSQGTDIIINDKCPIRIFLLDGSSKTLLVHTDTTVQEVCAVMCRKLGFKNQAAAKTYFSIFSSKDGNKVDRPLPEKALVYEEQQVNAKLFYMVKLFLDSSLESTDPKILKMFYIQAVYDVVFFKYKLEIAEQVKLAALQAFVNFGPFNEQVHKVGFLASKLLEYIPRERFNLLKPDVWEARIYNSYLDLPTANSVEARNTCMKNYLAICQKLDYYGCTLYPVQQTHFKEFSKNVMLAIDGHGIKIMEEKLAEHKAFELNCIYRWGFKPSTNFYFEVKQIGGTGPVYEFSTENGGDISDLLTDYAMGLLQEMGIKAMEEKQMADAQGQYASIIQARWRGAAVRKQMFKDSMAYAKTMGGVISDMKSAAESRKKLEALQNAGLMSEEQAAEFVQKLWRGYKARCEFDKKLEAMFAEMEAEGVSEEF